MQKITVYKIYDFAENLRKKQKNKYRRRVSFIELYANITCIILSKRITVEFDAEDIEKLDKIQKYYNIKRQSDALRLCLNVASNNLSSDKSIRIRLDMQQEEIKRLKDSIDLLYDYPIISQAAEEHSAYLDDRNTTD